MQMLDALTLEEIAQSMERALRPCIRVNTLKHDVAAALAQWEEWYDWGLSPIAWCPAGFRLTRDSANISWTVEHRMGSYYIQDAASMLPAEMLTLTEAPNPLVLDMAAAPGGKTTHLVSRNGDRGLLIANDSNMARLPSLTANLQRWGATSAAITNFPGERFGKWFPEVFDKVLLDAPCSGEALRTTSRHTSRLISSQDRDNLRRRQINLIFSAFEALRPGGELVYSTCALAPEEDEAVIVELLKLYPSQAELISVESLLPSPAPGLLSDGRHEFEPSLALAVRMWPHLFDTSGFFAALIRKRDSTLSAASQSASPPSRALSKAGYSVATAEERRRVLESLRDSYGFDLDGILRASDLTLLRHGNAMYAAPERFLAQFPGLPFAAVGLNIGKRSTGRFVPSHELIARFSSDFMNRRVMIDDMFIDAWLSGQDLTQASVGGYHEGDIVLIEDSKRRYLGRGRIDGDHLHNMLPRWQ